MKDPAFLFYSRDFYEGTRTMIPEERACYIDLLVYQHQNGFIPNEPNRLVMYCSGVSKETLDSVLLQKFILTDNKWINIKLQKVIDERIEFSSKQSINGKVGQFWKKTKSLLKPKDYMLIKSDYDGMSNKEVYESLLEIDIKNEAMLKAMLEAKLKHLAIANAIEDNSINWDKLLEQFNKVTGKKAMVINEKVKQAFRARIKEGYTKQCIIDAITNCFKDEYHVSTNHKYLTLEFISRPDKMERYSTVKPNTRNAIKEHKL